VPFTLGFQVYPWIERALAVRRNFFAAYGFALAIVVFAALVRWLVGDHVGARIPFATFFPAIIIATLIGGLWPGIVATVLSALSAWYLFLTPQYSWLLGERELAQLLVFVFVAGFNVAIVAVLDALIKRLIIQQRNIRILLESAPNGFVLVDGQGTIKLVNASTEKLFGYQRRELTGKRVEFLVPEQHVDAHRSLRVAYQERPTVRLMGLGQDLSGRRKDGTEFPVEIGLNPVGQDGEQAVLATVIDISARKHAEEHQRLIVGELEHRTRNLLAVVQAIIGNSLKDAKTVAEAQHVLDGRMKALAQAYAILSNAAWEGASLEQILNQQLFTDSKRVVVDGCDIMVSPRAAQQFALIIHELSTNALKYGALSGSAGRVSIKGSINRVNGSEQFIFSWKESDGPRVSPPTRKGFGSAILLDAARLFGSHVSMNYAPEGLDYRLEIDLKSIEVRSRTGMPPDRLAARVRAGTA
jgi:PAS domain S-box-containing protein